MVMGEEPNTDRKKHRSSQEKNHPVPGGREETVKEKKRSPNEKALWRGFLLRQARKREELGGERKNWEKVLPVKQGRKAFTDPSERAGVRVRTANERRFRTGGGGRSTLSKKIY